jgi:uncharacterized integral membrane protein
MALTSIKKLAQYLIILTLAALLFVFIARFPNHFSDASWPAHAKAHLFSQLSIGAGFSIFALIISVRFFRPQYQWAWWALLGFGIFSFGGYWAGKILIEPDAQWRNGNTVFVVLSVSYLLGLSLSWRHFFNGTKGSP